MALVQVAAKLPGVMSDVESVLAHSQEIMVLARSKTPESRERLLGAVSELCDRNPGACKGAEAQDFLQEIFMGVVVQAERDIRQRLSERLSCVTWAPPALISVLALDDIEIARPVIANSPILKDHDLIRLLVEATLEHQIEVARRPAIGLMVVNAIIDLSQPEVLIALSGNDTAEVSPLAMQRMVVASRRIAALRGSLAQHPKLTQELAEALYGWVGEAVRANIAGRFKLPPALLAESVDEAVADAAAEPSARTTEDALRERDEMERRLIAKLQAADQLRPGYLLRALREGRLARFEAALTALGGFPTGSVRKAVSLRRCQPLALACHAVGIDRSVFPTVISLVRALNGGGPPSSPEGLQRINEAFAMPPEQASEAFKQAVAGI
jgi:uncharacterized protein (DUF2336 family)